MSACFSVEWLRCGSLLRGVSHFEWSMSSTIDCTLAGRRRNILSTGPSVLFGVQVDRRIESWLLILLVIRGPLDRGIRKDLCSNRCHHRPRLCSKAVLRNEIVHIKRCVVLRDMGKSTLVLRDESVMIPRKRQLAQSVVVPLCHEWGARVTGLCTDATCSRCCDCHWPHCLALMGSERVVSSKYRGIFCTRWFSRITGRIMMTAMQLSMTCA